MRCVNCDKRLEPQDNGFVCPICGFKVPFGHKKSHETHHREKTAKSNDGEAVFKARD